MAETIYRKYRPQAFADVAEQTHVTRTLKNQIAQGTVAHAYLFAGPRGVGKTTVARILAKALNCEGRQAGEGEPCNACGACVDMAAGRMLSVIEIDAASQTGVDNVRENIIENARFAPTRGKYKVFILDEVHMLSGPSFNALLKTLEEPPAHAIFILATTELHKIPATILSRCQRFDFHRIPPSEMIPRLQKLAAAEGVAVDDDVLGTLARLSEGCLRDAESLLGQLIALGEKNISAKEASLVLPMTYLATVVDLADAVSEKQVERALALLVAFVEEGGSIKHLTDELVEYVRTLMFAALGFAPDAYDPKTMEALKASAGKIGVDGARRFLDLLLTARVRSSLSAFPQLPLEVAIVEFCTGSLAAPVPAAPAPAPIPVSPAPIAPPQAPAAAPAKAAIPRTDFSAPATPPPTADASAPAAAEPGVISLEELQGKWERCAAVVAETNVALPLILRSAKPVAIDGATVTVECAYGFHADALNEMKNKRLLENAIEKVIMTRVAVVATHVAKKSEDAVEDFVTALGGAL